MSVDICAYNLDHTTPGHPTQELKGVTHHAFGNTDQTCWALNTNAAAVAVAGNSERVTNLDPWAFHIINALIYQPNILATLSTHQVLNLLCFSAFVVCSCKHWGTDTQKLS